MEDSVHTFLVLSCSESLGERMPEDEFVEKSLFQAMA